MECFPLQNGVISEKLHWSALFCRSPILTDALSLQNISQPIFYSIAIIVKIEQLDFPAAWEDRLFALSESSQILWLY